MIVKRGSGFQVKSEQGKNLSRSGMTEAAARRRLAQVEMFKAMGNRPRPDRPKGK